MNRYLLKEGKKNKILGKVQNALYNFDKKKNKEVLKACKNTFEEEEEMKKWSLGSIIGAIGIILTIFWTYTTNTQNQAKSFQKLVSGQEKGRENQARLIKLTEKIMDKQGDIRERVARVEGVAGVNNGYLKTLISKPKR